MTGNKIVLYKAPWNFSTLYQPYFMSDAARDSYLSKLPFIDIIEKGNINIHFDYNLEAELVIPIDYSVAIDYNFCMIIYNGRKFYSSILDYYQSSVGYTKIQIRRHTISEKTNFFQYFERFQISKATFPEDFSYGLGTKFLLPKFRTVQKRVVPTVYLNTFDLNGLNIKEEVYFRPFYLLYLDKSITGEYYSSKPYGEVIQYLIVIVPAKLDTDYNQHLYTAENSVKYRTPNYFSESDANHGVPLVYTQSLNSDDLDLLSPYIKSMELIYMPIIANNDILPFIWQRIKFDKISGMTDRWFLQLESTQLHWYNSEGNTSRFLNEYYSMSIEIDDSDYFGNLTLIFGCNDNRLTFPIYEKKRIPGVLNFSMYFIFDVNGSSYQVKCSGDLNSIKQGLTSVQNYSFMCDYTFLLDQDSNFDAQNKYYDAMTRNAKRQKILNGAINAGTEFALGTSQIGFGQQMGASGKIASTSMGVGNMIRGVGTVLETANDVAAYSEERRLYKLNEKAKPDVVISGDNALSRCIEWDGVISFIYEVPFTEDYNSWLDDKQTYGIDCDIHRDVIDFSEFLIMGTDVNTFFLQALPVKKTSAILSVQEYNDMYNLIRGGCRYFLIEES